MKSEEKEIKFIIKGDIDKIKKHIQDAGFEYLLKKEIKDTYYDDKDFSLTKSEKGFRKREYDDVVEYEYKEKIDGRVFEEKLTEEVFKEKTENFKNIFSIEKERIVFKKNRDRILLDRVKDVGDILEIECEDENVWTVFEKLDLKAGELEHTEIGLNDLWLKKNLKL